MPYAKAAAEIAARQEELRVAQLDLTNAQRLRRDNLIAATELNQRQPARTSSRSGRNSGEAAKAQAEAAVRQAEAQN